jgi:3-phenylpropionate/trans-cinnamate dioxygenase ferredoxin subunit
MKGIPNQHMSEFIKVAAVDEFEEGVVKGFRVLGKDVAVVTWRGNWYAFRNVCTHSAYSFDHLCLGNDGTLTCGAHSAQFVVETGEAIAGPTRAPLPVYKAKLDGDTVCVAMD